MDARRVGGHDRDLVTYGLSTMFRMGDPAILDAAYERLHVTGPEFEGWLSNHGPMAVDALIRLGRGGAVQQWLDGYCDRLEDLPAPRWAIADDWREFLGDASRLGDWLTYFAGGLLACPWRDVLSEWWPRLLPGAPGAATHGLIRTGHAVRALIEAETPPRVSELAQALAYWAARWEPLAGATRPRGVLLPGAALEHLEGTRATGGFRTQLAALGESPGWPASMSVLEAVASPEDVPGAFDVVVDAAVDYYLRWGHGNPIMMVHAATAPRAAALVLPAIPVDLWVETADL